MQIMNIMESLNERVQELGCAVCVGMDPRFSGKARIPDYLLEEHDNDQNSTILEFNVRILEAVGDIVPVIKPQFAYYEARDALDALKQTIQKAKNKGILVILDAKMNDIGSTSQAYATAAFEGQGADRGTVNGELGTERGKPVLDREDNGIFILVKTSNPSSIEFQDLFSVNIGDIDASKMATTISGQKITLERNYMKMARLVNLWNDEYRSQSEKFGPTGAVIGATFPTQLKELRRFMPDSMFLIPGFGAQGGTAKDVKPGFHDDGSGAVVNSSRGLLYAYEKSEIHACAPENFENATRNELMMMKDAIEKVRS